MTAFRLLGGLRRSKAGEELAEDFAALVATLGELETVLLALPDVIVNEQLNAVKLCAPLA